MATKIKRSLYIGLGGTGMNSLLHTKKMFIDTYGEVPPMISFLGIDTDGGAYKKEINSRDGEIIKLMPNEQLPIFVDDARAIYEVYKEKFSWIPKENIDDLDKMTLGAGQIRTNGRFAFSAHYKDVVDKVRGVLDQITNAQILNNASYELLSSDIEIHIVFSLGGGTGCGTFINMAYLLRKEVPNCKLTGYAVLPDVFEAMSNFGMKNVKPNAYGAMVDLDYLMHMGISSEPLQLEYVNHSYEIKKEPFDAVIFIDNKNSNGDTYTHIDELTEMISLALVTSAGELSTATASVVDNLAKEIRRGTRSIENKKAWCGGMGICELVYRNSLLSEVYAIKAAKILIERMFNSCKDTDTIVNAWIDSPEVNIREDNGHDHVIDYIADKMPTSSIESIDPSDPTLAVNLYLQQNKIKDDIIASKVTNLVTKVRKELRKLLIKHINEECGVETCSNIIDGIEAQIQIFKKEMLDEKQEFEDKLPKFDVSVKSAIEDLKNYDKKFFKLKRQIDSLEEDLRGEVEKYCICCREIIRHNAAIQVFNAIQAILEEARSKVKVIKDNLKVVGQLLISDLANKQNAINSDTQIFQIDLARTLVTSMVVNQEEILIHEFVNKLNGDGKIYGFVEYSPEEIKDFVLKYTRGLHTTRKQKNTTIDDIINGYSEEELDKILNLAINKSMTLLRYDYQGYTPEERPSDRFYIGVRDRDKSRLKNNDYLKNLISGTSDCDFSNIGSTEKIIIYRVMGVLPSYAIKSIKDSKFRYDNNAKPNCHIDYNWEMRMQREEFLINPKREKDDDIFDFWVKGFIFGLIKNEDGEYMFKCKERGDALDDYWLGLGKYRDEAFDKFRTYKSFIRKEFSETLEDIVKNKGEEVINSFLVDVKNSYLEKYSQINMTKEEIKKKGFERIRQLITEEIKLAQSILGK